MCTLAQKACFDQVKPRLQLSMHYSSAELMPLCVMPVTYVQALYSFLHGILEIVVFNGVRRKKTSRIQTEKVEEDLAA